MKYIIVVDMQNDFLTGALGSETAAGLVPDMAKYLSEAANKETYLFYTMDTHSKENYAQSIEGQKLPVEHCIYETEGWLIRDELCTEEITDKFANAYIVLKDTFGSTNLVNKIWEVIDADEKSFPTSFEVMGVCTDICVISNVLLLKAAFPNVPISVNSKFCAGVTTESHETALKAMSACHIDIV